MAAAIFANPDLWRWITVGIAALSTLNMEREEDRALWKLWVDKTNAILARGPDATPTEDEWAEVDAFAAFEHAKIQAST